MALTRTQLDRALCSTPGCTHEDHSLLYLGAQCHPRAKTFTVAYAAATGKIVCRCAVCDELVAAIAVKD